MLKSGSKIDVSQYPFGFLKFSRKPYTMNFKITTPVNYKTSQYQLIILSKIYPNCTSDFSGPFGVNIAAVTEKSPSLNEKKVDTVPQVFESCRETFFSISKLYYIDTKLFANLFFLVLALKFVFFGF